MSDRFIGLVRQYMLSEQEVFEIAEATKRPDEHGSLSLWWLALPCLLSIIVLALLMIGYR